MRLNETGEGHDPSLDDSGKLPVKDEERLLKEALFALNRAIVDDQTVAGGQGFGVVWVRDEIWVLGERLYGWSD